MINTNLDRELHMTSRTIWTGCLLKIQVEGLVPSDIVWEWGLPEGFRRFSEFMRVGPWLYVTGVLSSWSGSDLTVSPWGLTFASGSDLIISFRMVSYLNRNVFHLRPLTDNSNSETHWCEILDFYWAGIPLPSTQSSGHRVVWLYAEVPSHPPT